jgi:hypothetical protein
MRYLDENPQSKREERNIHANNEADETIININHNKEQIRTIY